MTKEIKLGMAIERTRDKYYFNELLKFIRGKSDDGFYFQFLKPLFDEFGYDTVIGTLTEIAWEDDKKGENNNE